MADEAELLKALKDAHELAGIGVNVVGEDVFVDRTTRRRVDGNEFIRLDPHRQSANELPPIGPAGDVRVAFKDASRPETRGFSAAVEVVRLVEHREVVISHQRRATTLADGVEAFHRIWAIT